MRDIRNKRLLDIARPLAAQINRDLEQSEAAGLQYAAFVHYAEALIERRAEANRFFLAANTAIVGG